jgi:hypothetical protein
MRAVNVARLAPNSGSVTGSCRKRVRIASNLARALPADEP